MVNIFVAIIGLFSAAIGTVGVTWVKYILAIKREQKKQRIDTQRHADFISEAASIFGAVTGLVQHPDIHRVLFMRGKNNGGVPMPGNPYYIEATYEAQKDNAQPRRNLMQDYSDFQADDQYFRMLEEMIKSGHPAKLLVSEMPESKLKRSYLTEGITYSEIYPLKLTPQYFYFMSIASRKEGLKGWPDNATSYEVERTVEKAQGLYRRTYGE